MPESDGLQREPTDQRHQSHFAAVSGDGPADDITVAIASLHAMGSGNLADFQALYTADAVNREAKAEPPDTRGTGPTAMYATARWLRTAFSDLAWEVRDVAHDNDLVVVHVTMSGRQTGPFVAYRPDATVVAVFPPRGRTFAVTQTHWFRMSEGKVAEHWANRDDLAMGQQLGWSPPTPLYLARMLLASRRARRTQSPQLEALPVLGKSTASGEFVTGRPSTTLWEASPTFCAGTRPGADEATSPEGATPVRPQPSRGRAPR